MDRLTREDIAYFRLTGKVPSSMAQAPFKQALCDLALQSLSLESVRSEARRAALEEAAKLCETQAPFLPSLAVALRYRALSPARVAEGESLGMLRARAGLSAHVGYPHDIPEQPGEQK